jgi:hypothetical protein
VQSRWAVGFVPASGKDRAAAGPEMKPALANAGGELMEIAPDRLAGFIKAEYDKIKIHQGRGNHSRLSPRAPATSSTVRRVMIKVRSISRATFETPSQAKSTAATWDIARSEHRIPLRTERRALLAFAPSAAPAPCVFNG